MRPVTAHGFQTCANQRIARFILEPGPRAVDHKAKGRATWVEITFVEIAFGLDKTPRSAQLKSACDFKRALAGERVAIATDIARAASGIGFAAGANYCA